MTAFRARAGLAALAATGLLTGCSGNSALDAGPTTGPAANPLTQCNPLTDDQITQAVHADSLTAHHRPPVCAWTAQRGDDESDLTFTFSDHDSLQLTWQRAQADGFETEHLTITKQVLGTTVTATGFYVKNPHDAGDCAVVASDNGTITWRVQNRSHTAKLDPCATALQLTTLTIDLSP